MARGPACQSMSQQGKSAATTREWAMEFTLDLRSEVMVIPAGAKLGGTDRRDDVGKGGLEWQAQYAVAATNALGVGDGGRRRQRARAHLRST